MRNAEEIGIIIKRICDKKKIPLSKLSEDLLIDIYSIKYLLKGKIPLSFYQYKQIADYLEISIEDLLEEDPRKLGIDTRGISIKSKIMRFINGFRYRKFYRHK